MSEAGAKRALVIGGSLAGLFNAITLRAIGWQVDVFERTPHALTSRGGGIVLQPDVVRVLNIGGVAQDQPLGVEVRERLYLAPDGSVERRLAMGQTLTSWGLLYQLARRAVPDDCYHLDARLVDIEETDDAVTAVFAGGRRASGDLLVGADGVNSTVRRLKLPRVEPAYAGYVAWRGLVPESDFTGKAAELLRERFVWYQYHRSHILDYLIPAPDGSIAAGKRSFNWVWYRNVPVQALDELLADRNGRGRPTSVPPGLLRPEPLAELRQAARQQLPPPMAELVCATEEPFIQTILDLQVRRMVFGRTLLTGDAAAVPRPHTAASTSKAAANAIELAQALQDTDDISGTLAAWEQSQLYLGRSLVQQGRDAGDRSQFPERVGRG